MLTLYSCTFEGVFSLLLLRSWSYILSIFPSFLLTFSPSVLHPPFYFIFPYVFWASKLWSSNMSLKLHNLCIHAFHPSHFWYMRSFLVTLKWAKIIFWVLIICFVYMYFIQNFSITLLTKGIFTKIRSFHFNMLSINL